VVVDSRRFTPAITAVPAGTIVTWTNRDGVPHSIVSAERHFTSPVLDADQRCSRRFDVPGTYAYFCSLYPQMTGQIVVG
jgi:plastocyanin